jgi:hypothetical protein
VTRRQPFPGNELEELAIAVGEPSERSSNRLSLGRCVGLGGGPPEGRIQAQPNLEPGLTPVSTALVGEGSTRYPVKPQPPLVAGWDVIDATPRDQEGLSDDVGCLLEGAAPPQGVPEERHVICVVDRAKPLVAG